MDWMILPLHRYAQFHGRSRRKEYWMFVLFNILVSIILTLVGSALGFGGQTGEYASWGSAGSATGAYTRGGILSSVWFLAILVPSFALGVRRLHDIDRTGWWLAAPMGPIMTGAGLLLFKPLAGNLLLGIGGFLAIILFVWSCIDGTRGSNRFGLDPKGTVGDF